MHGPLAPPLAAPESSGLRFFRSLSKIRSIAVAGISVVNRPRFEDSVGQLRSPIIRKFALTAPFVRADRGWTRIRGSTLPAAATLRFGRPDWCQPFTAISCFGLT